MKTFCIVVALVLVLSGIAAGRDSLFVKMQGDTVQLWNTGAQSYCCLKFTMEATVSNDTITWLEIPDDNPCRCLCVYDFSVSVLGLAPGTYYVNILRREVFWEDSVSYIGSTSFNVNSSSSTLKQVASYQSPCLGNTDVDLSVTAFPRTYGLDLNYPNPFNPATTIKYTLPVQSKVRLTVYNILGQLAGTPVDRIEPAGEKTIRWDASHLTSGVYYYRLEAASTSDPSKIFSQTHKMTLLR